MQADKPGPGMQPVNTPPTADETPSSQQITGTNEYKKWVLIGFIALLLGSTGLFAYRYYNLKQQIDDQQPAIPALSVDTVVTDPAPTLALSPSPNPAENLKTYNNEEHQFSFEYPQDWQINTIEGSDGPGVSFSNIGEGHILSVNVWRVTGFGYCYDYGNIRTIVVDGKDAQTADGVGGTENCDNPSEFVNQGNTYVLIPIGDETNLPRTQIHISYHYPLEDKSLAQSNLNQILSTFQFVD